MQLDALSVFKMPFLPPKKAHPRMRVGNPGPAAAAQVAVGPLSPYKAKMTPMQRALPTSAADSGAACWSGGPLRSCWSLTFAISTPA